MIEGTALITQTREQRKTSSCRASKETFWLAWWSTASTIRTRSPRISRSPCRRTRWRTSWTPGTRTSSISTVRKRFWSWSWPRTTWTSSLCWSWAAPRWPPWSRGRAQRKYGRRSASPMTSRPRRRPRSARRTSGQKSHPTDFVNQDYQVWLTTFPINARIHFTLGPTCRTRPALTSQSSLVWRSWRREVPRIAPSTTG